MVSKTVFKTVGPPKPIYEINSVTKKSGLRLYEVAENKWYPFVKPCVLESLSVDYGPGGESQHFRPVKTAGGDAPAPVEMNLALNFTETEIITKESVAEGY